MHTGLIPPISALNTIRSRPFHLVLAHLLSDHRYIEFYESIGKTSFLTLDNSAHEFSEGQPLSQLTYQGRRIHASEIVIPDVLFDRERTVVNAEAALNAIPQLGWDDWHPQLMFVAQGNSRPDLTRCVWELVGLVEQASPKLQSIGLPKITLGISKDYEIFPGGILHFLEETLIPAADVLEADIHLLGWGRRLWDLREIAQVFGSRIRSTDSARPYVYAMSGIKLDPRYFEIPPYPKRRKDYFQCEYSPDEIAQHNIEVFEATARGEVI